MEAALAKDKLENSTETFGPAAPPPESESPPPTEEKKDENALGPELNPKFDLTDYQEDTWFVLVA